ncbi:MAG TPA: type II toxin-antitoxin system RelE/ParE family toxin [Nitrososphaerales archaeon]|nr:type II toxin-antitoxin system RelE/ParE family toxin [Nitrososphaerales archaeon]
MTSRVFYKSSVARDLKKIAPMDKRRILQQIEEVLGSDPRRGEALRGEFGGLFKLRVGEYRVVYALADREILVLRIRHRGKAYD